MHHVNPGAGAWIMHSLSKSCLLFGRKRRRPQWACVPECAGAGGSGGGAGLRDNAGTVEQKRGTGVRRPGLGSWFQLFASCPLVCSQPTLISVGLFEFLGGRPTVPTPISTEVTW